MDHAVLKRSDLPSPGDLEGMRGMTSFAGKVRDVYREALGEIERIHRSGTGGIEITRMCSASVEVVVGHLFDSLWDWMGARVGRKPAIIALGKFGRKELSPESDVDLLFLWGRRGVHAAGEFAGYLVRMMWDSGFHLGHSVRTLSELRKAMRGEPDLKAAIIDGRWLCGDMDLRGELDRIKVDLIRKHGGELLESRLELTSRRWAKFGGSYRLIEPRVKESPGGLMDFQTLRWIGMALPWDGTLKGLHRLDVMGKGEIRDLQHSFDYLLRTRNELHFLAGSDWNILTLELQGRAAAGLGYGKKDSPAARERFMADYYSRTRPVFKVMERFLAEVYDTGDLRILDGFLYRKVGTKGLGRIDVILRRDKLKADPLFVFKEQVSSGNRIRRKMEKRIIKAFGEMKLDSPTLKRMKSSFIELLRMPGRKAHAIRSMHELGVLQHVIPHFGKLACLESHELYHQFTADEHCLQAISHLEDLGDREKGLLPRIFSEVAEKTELILAVLLHDIGKVRGRGCARSAAGEAARLLDSFPLSVRSRSLVGFLVRNHLLLEHFSQRRDMEDVDTSLLFVKKIKNNLNLKLLYLLTYADLKATGREVWTGWKEDLLDALYYKASHMLGEKSEARSAYLKVLEERRGRLLAAAVGQNARKRMKEHIDSLPDRYSMVVSPVQACGHLSMIEKLRGKRAVTRFRRLRNSIEMSVCTRDKPFRLAQMCGVITVNDLNILSAYAFTRRDGVVIDLFHLERFDGGLSLAGDARRKIAKEIDDVLGGRMKLEEAYRKRAGAWEGKKAPGAAAPCVVEFENDLSGESTIIDLTAMDRPGLLYRVTHIFSEEGLDIKSAKITTRGGVAADSFYVRTSAGEKIRDFSLMRRIRQRLTAELEP